MIPIRGDQFVGIIEVLGGQARRWNVPTMKLNTTPVNDCTPVNSTDILPGTSSHCDCFIDLPDYYNGAYGCSDIEGDYALTASQSATYNTWLGSSNCDTALYSNLLSNETRPVCVGVNASEPVGSVSSGQSETSTATTITSGSITIISSMGPTASGEVRDEAQI